MEELSECGFFVLVFRSAVSRLAYGLALARQARHRPAVSMQWAWGGANPSAVNGKGVRGGKGKRGGALSKG